MEGYRELCHALYTVLYLPSFNQQTCTEASPVENTGQW